MNIPNLIDLGADPTGATDSAPSVQAAVDLGGLIWVPPGTYRLDRPVTITKAVRLMGSGAGWWNLSGNSGQSSEFTTANLAQDLFYINANGVTFEDLFFNRVGGSNVPSDGNALVFGTVPAAVGQAWCGATVKSCRFAGHCRSIWMQHMQAWRVLASDLYSCYGLHIENRSNFDAGDANISDCTIMASADQGQTACIVYVSGGGLKVTNTKFLGGLYGFWHFFHGTGSIGPQISNCSFENHGAHAFYTDPASDRCDGMTMTGCHLDGKAPLIVLGTIRNAVITGNVLGTDGPTPGLIQVMAGAEDCLIAQNVCAGNLWGGGLAAAAVEGTGARGQIAGNYVQGCVQELVSN